MFYALLGGLSFLSSDEYAIDKCREAGFDDYFIKPFKVAEIISAMQDAFEKLLRWEYQEKADDDSE